MAKGIHCVTTGIDDAEIIPSTFTLAQNYPNPFNPRTTIQFSLESREQVTIEIFNSLGQKVRTLLNESRGAGAHTVEWNGMDDGGNEVSTGVYLYRLVAGEMAQTKKMVLVK